MLPLSAVNALFKDFFVNERPPLNLRKLLTATHFFSINLMPASIRALNRVFMGGIKEISQLSPEDFPLSP